MKVIIVLKPQSPLLHLMTLKVTSAQLVVIVSRVPLKQRTAFQVLTTLMLELMTLLTALIVTLEVIALDQLLLP